LVRLLPEEIVEIQGRADAAGLTAAAFVRRSCLSKTDDFSRQRVSYKARKSAYIYRDSADLLAQLSRVGNNLNQLAYLSNSGDAPAVSELQECLSKINVIADLITVSITPAEGDDE
jgi:hypothetical protein